MSTQSSLTTGQRPIGRNLTQSQVRLSKCSEQPEQQTSPCSFWPDFFMTQRSTCSSLTRRHRWRVLGVKDSETLRERPWTVRKAPTHGPRASSPTVDAVDGQLEPFESVHELTTPALAEIMKSMRLNTKLQQTEHHRCRQPERVAQHWHMYCSTSSWSMAT